MVTGPPLGSSVVATSIPVSVFLIFSKYFFSRGSSRLASDIWKGMNNSVDKVHNESYKCWKIKIELKVTIKLEP